MFNVGAGEMIVILMLALIVLGPDKLPGAAKQAGKYLSEFRRMSEGFQRELRDAMDVTSPVNKPVSGGGPTDVSSSSTSSLPIPAVDPSSNGAPSSPNGAKGAMAPTVNGDAINGDGPIETGPADTGPADTGLGPSHRVVESTNGPTLPPLDVVTPEVAPPSPSADRERASTAPNQAGSSAATAPSITIDVDGPSSSFS